MTSILFVRKPHVYLPEIPAYKAFLSEHYPGVSVSETLQDESLDYDAFDIVWHFMGLDTKGRGRYVVHEYNSLSTPPLAHLKNLIKKTVNKRPDRRVFLNEKVRHDFGFRDGAPSHIRDMGIDERFFNVKKNPEYDFVLAGGLGRGPVITKVLDCFATGALQDCSVILIGDAPQDMEDRYAGHDNIIFKGRVPYEDMPALMGRARYGLNIQPDVYPFNVQTSTKLLEYCATGLPVVTTGYTWAAAFEALYGARFFRLPGDMAGFDRQSVENYDFKVPDVSSLKWETIIAQSELFSFLET